MEARRWRIPSCRTRRSWISRAGAAGPARRPAARLASFTLNVALILDRANNPSTLLNANWASRQQQLNTLNDSGTLWSTYGADPAKYNQVLSDLAALHIKTVEQVAAEQGAQTGYVSSAESRTIWVQVDQTNIDKLFGPSFALHGDSTSWHWEGNLSLPDGWASALGVKGLWFDTLNFKPVLPDPGNGTLVPLPQGRQSLGNDSTSPTNIFPQQIADDYYNFPLSGGLWNPASGIAPKTGAIGLVEPGVGATVPAGSFGALLNQYRAELGINTPADWKSVAPGGEQYPTNIVPPAFNPAGERSLDVGVVTAINPQSPLVLYAGSGYSAGAQSNAFTAYQSAFWDLTHNPAVITSSFSFTQQATPGSPFYFAASRAVHRRRTAQHHGVQRCRRRRLERPVRQRPDQCRHQPGQPLRLHGGRHVLQHRRIGAGGPDASTTSSRRRWRMIRATVWQLMAGGLTDMPNPSNLDCAPGRGGVEQLLRHRHDHCDARRSPDRLSAQQYGLGRRRSQPAGALVPEGFRPRPEDIGSRRPCPAAACPTCRPMPAATCTTVSAERRCDGLGDGGTSAASPLWASLTAQIDTIFHDQGLPNLGYCNDLLYIAAAIAPGSFNDVDAGQQHLVLLRSAAPTPATTTRDQITPTGYGYSCRAGLRSGDGLGSPNGLLLARALTAIAHSQMSFSTSPPTARRRRHGGWTSGADQSLLFQTMSSTTARRSASTSAATRSVFASGARPLRLDQPAGAAVAAGRLRSRPGAAVRQAGAGRGGVGAASARARACRCHIDGATGAGDAGQAQQSVRLRRLLRRRRCRARRARRWRSPRRWAAPTTSSPSCACARAARTTCSSPSTRSTIWPARSTGKAPGDAGYAAAVQAVPTRPTSGGTGDHRAGLRPVRATAC